MNALWEHISPFSWDTAVVTFWYNQPRVIVTNNLTWLCINHGIEGHLCTVCDKASTALMMHCCFYKMYFLLSCSYDKLNRKLYRLVWIAFHNCILFFILMIICLSYSPNVLTNLLWWKKKNIISLHIQQLLCNPQRPAWRNFMMQASPPALAKIWHLINVIFVQSITETGLKVKFQICLCKTRITLSLTHCNQKMMVL